MTRQQAIYDVLRGYDTSELVSLVSYINSWDGSLDDMDWREMDMYELYEYCDERRTFELIVQAAADGEFNPRDDYYRWSYDGPESTDDPDFDLNEIAEWLDDNFDRLDRVLSDYFLDDFRGLDGEPEEEYDDSEYPDDPTDYDGVDDPDEDEQTSLWTAVLQDGIETTAPAAEPPEQEPMRHDALMLEAIRVISPAHPVFITAAVQEAQMRSLRTLGRKIMTCAELHDHLRCLGYMLIANP